MRWVVNATPRLLLPWEREPLLIFQEVGWAPRPVWKCAADVAFSGILSPDRSARSQLLYRQLLFQLSWKYYKKCTFTCSLQKVKKDYNSIPEIL